MIVGIALEGPAVLTEQDSFDGLKVTLAAGDTIAGALGLLGAVEAAEAGHVWIPADAMLAKVEPYGWYDPAAARVKTHVGDV